VTELLCYILLGPLVKNFLLIMTLVSDKLECLFLADASGLRLEIDREKTTCCSTFREH